MAGNPNAWPPEILDAVIGWWNAGQSATEIATRMARELRFPRTRNAVIGQVVRSGRSTRSPVSQQATLRVAGAPAAAKRAAPPKPRATAAPLLTPVTPPVDETLAARLVRAFKPLPAYAPVGVLDLRHNHCRWPVDGPNGEIMFCGAPKAEGSSYCMAHRSMGVTAFRPTQAKTGNELARQLRKFVA